MASRVETLLSELDALSYPARVQRMAKLGRSSGARLEGVLQELIAGDAYQAMLALHAAAAARHQATVLAGLGHASVTVRHAAARLVGRLIDDVAVLAAALQAASPAVRRLLLKVLGQRPRAAAEALFAQVLAEHGARDAVLLLSGCSAGFVQAALPDLAHALGSARMLTRRHPEVVLSFLGQRLAVTPPRARAALLHRFQAGLRVLVSERKGAAAVFALLAEFAPPDALPLLLEQQAGRFVAGQAAELVALLTRPTARARLLAGGVPDGVRKHFARFAAAQREALAVALAEAPEQLAELLEVLPPSQRGALFERVYPAAERAGRAFPMELLRALPTAVRDPEAARMLALREVTDDPARTLLVTSLRAIEHARAPLEQAARRSAADDRAAGLALLVQATGRSRRGLAETLAFLARLKNEQDPVRQQALASLTMVPPSLYADRHIPQLEALITWVVEARDTSAATRQSLSAVAIKLVYQHAAAPRSALFRFAIAALARLAGQTGRLVLPPLHENLPRGVEKQLLATFMPMFRAATKREVFGMVFALADALGRRGWALPELHKLIHDGLEARPDAIAMQATRLWLEPPKLRDQRIKDLIKRDPSIIALSEVFAHLHRRRQSWLDPYLAGKPIAGRFLTGKTVYVLPATSGFERWLPRQQHAFAKLLGRVSGDRERAIRERAVAVGRIARLPVSDVTSLAPYLEDPEVSVLEAALGALVWLDQPEAALPILSAHLDGDRARVAMYAVPRLARLSRPAELAAALRGLLGRERLKVTVRKEAVRLLGAYRSPASVALLEAEWARPDAHKDVRIAIGHAARRLLDAEASWRLCGDIARAAEPDLAESLLDQQAHDLPPAWRRRFADLILEVTRHADARVRGRAFVALTGFVAGAEEAIAARAADCVTDVNASEWRYGLGALIAACEGGLAVPTLAGTLRTLLAAPLDEAANATRQRDLPARQRALTLCSLLGALSVESRVLLRPHLPLLIVALAGDPTHWPELARLVLDGLDWRDPGDTAARLASLAAEAAAEPYRAAALSSALRASLDAAGTAWTPEQGLAVADRLAPGAAREATLAVAIVVAAGSRTSWRSDVAERLRALRRHASPEIRALAARIFTATE